MAAPIVLLTDFGHIDPYVGQMKGVLASLVPEVTVIDLCHGVRPQAVQQAAYFLCSSFMYFPEKSIFICVVDPGVGTDRNIICIHAADRYILAPDNGMVIPLFAEFPAADCYRIDLSVFEEASETFHGRDIFCPLAAQLAQGTPLSELGMRIHFSELQSADGMVPVTYDDRIECTIQHIDTFGNVVLNLTAIPWIERLAMWPELFIMLTPPVPVIRTTTFGQLPKNTLGCIPGSQGYLELVLNGASAATFLKLDIGDTIALIGSFIQDNEHASRNQ